MVLRSTQVPLLIVEDDANLRYLLQAAAERTGVFAPIHACADGAEAWAYLQTCPPDERPALIASDLSMPNMTGLELLRAVKADSGLRLIPVAIITSSDTPDDREIARAAGACAFVPKPFGLEALVRVLSELHDTCVEAVAESQR